MQQRPHAVQLFLAPEIRSGVIQLMAKYDLDKEYACQLLVVRGLYQEKVISKEVYDLYVHRYSKTLSSLADHEPVKLTLEQQDEKQRRDEKTRQFSMVLEQWQIHGAEWRSKWVAEAKKYPELEQAKLVVDLGGKQA